MSIVDRPYEESYPPSLWGGGGGPDDPHIDTLAPATGSAAAGPIAITVTGVRFEDGAEVEFNQVAAPTTYVSATTLTTSYDPSAAGTVQVTVRNPNDEESNSVAFLVTTLQADPGAVTVAQAQQWVDEHPELADEVLEAELARGDAARVTLLDWLRGFIAHRDDELEESDGDAG